MTMQKTEILDAKAPESFTEVAEYSSIAIALNALTLRLKDVAYDLSTGAGIEIAKKDRAELRTHRTSLEKKRVELNKLDRATIAEKIEKRDKEAERITAAIVAMEKPIDDQIKAEEKRKEDEKAAKQEAERVRVAAIHERIASISKLTIGLIGKDSATILAAMESAKEAGVGDDFAEFKDHAAAVLADALVKTSQLYESTLRAEQAAAFAKAEHERMAAEAAAREEEHKAAQEKLEAERAAFEAQQAEAKRVADELAAAARKAESDRAAAAAVEAARVTAIKERMQEIGYAVVHMADKRSTEIRAKSDALLRISLDGFDEFHQQAEDLRNLTAKRLQGMADAAAQAEHDAEVLKQEQEELHAQRKADADAKAAAEAVAAAQAAEDQRAKARAALAESQRLAAVRGAAEQMLKALLAVVDDDNWDQLDQETMNKVSIAVAEALAVKSNAIK